MTLSADRVIQQQPPKLNLFGVGKKGALNATIPDKSRIKENFILQRMGRNDDASTLLTYICETVATL